jgi:putative ABC transport system permease protein
MRGVGEKPALVGAGALLAVAGVVTAAPLIAGPAAHLITVPMAYVGGRPRRVPVTVALARDNITANPHRTAVTAAILTIGLAAATALSIVATSARASARAVIDGSSRADLYVQGDIDPRLARAIAAQPGVRATMRIDYPLVEVAGARVRVGGIDPGRAALLMNYGVRAGALTALRGNVVIVSTLQADRHGWHIDSPVTIDFGQGAPRTLRVAGIFTDRRFAGDDYLMPLATLFRDMPAQLDSSDLVLVRAAAGIRPGAIRSGIGNLLRGYPGDSVLTATQYQHGRAADLGDVSHVLGVLTALVTLTVLVATLGLANTLALSVAERAGEFGVLRAPGLTRRELAAMIRAEAVLTCLLGALPGAAIGAEAGAGLAAALTRGQTGVATIAVSPGQLAAAVAATCLAALLAGSSPAGGPAASRPCGPRSSRAGG